MIQGCFNTIKVGASKKLTESEVCKDSYTHCCSIDTKKNILVAIQKKLVENTTSYFFSFLKRQLQKDNQDTLFYLNF